VSALALLLALAAPALAADELRLPPVMRATFDNGLRVLVAEYHELPLVEFHLIVGAGAAQDPAGKEGLAALTAGTLTRGTGKLSADELARAIDGLGGRISATPGSDGTIVTAEFLSKDFRAGLDLLRQVLLDPAFARDEVRRRRDEQAADIVAALENTSAVADKCFAGFLYGTHPYGRPIDGRSTTVPKLGRGDVADFYARWYRPNDTILVLVGDVAAAEATVRLREAFGAWRPRPDAVAARAAPPPRLTARRVLLVDKPDATQTQIRLGNVAIARSDPEYVPATVANTILGGGFTSQLIEELRIKRSLTYSAWRGSRAATSAWAPSPRRRPRPRRSRSPSRWRASSGPAPPRARASPKRRRISAASSRSASRAPRRSPRASGRRSSTRSDPTSSRPTASAWPR